MRLIPVCSVTALLIALSFGCEKKAATESTTAVPTVADTPASIEGEYMIAGAEMWGEPFPPEELTKAPEAERKVTIGKDTIQIALFNQPTTFQYAIDASKSPKTIDTTRSSAKAKDDGPRYGIYKLEGDTLTIVMAGAKKPENRPKEFKTVPHNKGVPAEAVDGAQFIVSMKKR